MLSLRVRSPRVISPRVRRLVVSKWGPAKMGNGGSVFVFMQPFQDTPRARDNTSPVGHAHGQGVTLAAGTGFRQKLQLTGPKAQKAMDSAIRTGSVCILVGGLRPSHPSELRTAREPNILKAHGGPLPGRRRACVRHTLDGQKSKRKACWRVL